MTTFEKQQLEKIRNQEAKILELCANHRNLTGSLNQQANIKNINDLMLEMKIETDSYLRLSKIKTELHTQDTPFINSLNVYLK